MSPNVFRALFQIGTLRDEVHALRHEMTSTEERRFLVQLDFLEAAAWRLLNDSERRRPVSSH